MDTPRIVIDEQRLEANIKDMAVMARKAGVALRPHIKSHKLPQLAHKQLAVGACGITVAKLGEAEVMAEHGIKDIFIANEVMGSEKFERLSALARRIKLAVGVDSPEGAKALAQGIRVHGIRDNNGMRENGTLDVLIEVDSGLKRCGVEPGREVVRLAKEISRLENLRLRGIFTHAGHSYGAADRTELEKIALAEGEVMVEIARDLRQEGIDIEVVSVGATPTVAISAFVPGVTEIRPGNYVFYDAMQLALGVIPSIKYCSLRVYSTVISHPAPNRWVLDAGSKALSLDKGAHGHSGVEGHGIIIGQPKLRIVRLSEEHGVAEGESSLKVGDVVEIVPNHACTVVNLFDEVEVWNGAEREIWGVAARGKNR
ncbi:D-TA family PLP-dependent enzyme [Paradesulfitobacterium aromaticivorans]